MYFFSVDQLSIWQICKFKHITIEICRPMTNWSTENVHGFLQNMAGWPHITRIFPLDDMQKNIIRMKFIGHLNKRSVQSILFDMATIFVEWGKYEFPYLLTLQMTFTQNQLQNISEPNLIDHFFFINKPEFYSILPQRCTSREPPSSELEPKHLLIQAKVAPSQAKGKLWSKITV